MPWSSDDADRFKKGLSPEQKQRWAAVANDALKRGADEASAVRQASGAVSNPGKLAQTARRRLASKMRGE